MGGLYTAGHLHQANVCFGLANRLKCQKSIQTRRIETELFGDARPDTRLLPQSRTFNILACATGAISRARLLQHAAANTRTSLPDLLNLFPSGIGEPSSHLWLCRLLIHAEICREVRLAAIGVHGYRPWRRHILMHIVILGQHVVSVRVIQKRINRRLG
jgi:hypothetical protein